MISFTKYQLIENISVTDVDDEMVLLNLSTGAYFGLNHIGARFVHGLKRQLPIEQTVREIADQYQMDFSVVSADIERLIKQLLEQSLLTESD